MFQDNLLEPNEPLQDSLPSLCPCRTRSEKTSTCCTATPEEGGGGEMLRVGAGGKRVWARKSINKPEG
jgi:hypothetical protein